MLLAEREDEPAVEDVERLLEPTMQVRDGPGPRRVPENSAKVNARPVASSPPAITRMERTPRSTDLPSPG